jgi:hypothetical protein
MVVPKSVCLIEQGQADCNPQVGLMAARRAQNEPMEPLEIDGPSERCVKLARAWLYVAGWGWLVLGISVAVVFDINSLWATAILFALAIAHFVVARFANRRVAVFFALFGA